MGLTASIILTTEQVSPQQLESWGLVPTQDNGDLWSAFHDPAQQFFTLAQLGEWSLLWDPQMVVAEFFEADSIALPGTWHVASTVSSAGFVDYRVFVDGTLVRHLMSGDEELDEGEPVVDESGFVFMDGDQAEPLAEVDGDLIIQKLPSAVGAVSRDEDVFTVRRQYFAYTHPSLDSAGTEPDSSQAADASTGDQPKKNSFFGRLFGKK
ncbi:hypothetical protein [Brevibacterium paucivorans]|uniref:hypothetical protein n=1 Tax=Brevibacterium paucivorans TaxID=170994 RepID=UPI0032197B6D